MHCSVDLRNRLQNEEIDPDTDMSYLYITAENEVLQGVCSLRELLSANPQKQLKDLMTTSIISVGAEDDQEHAAHVIADYDLAAVPVLSEENGKIIGIITVDDVIDVIEEEYTEDMLKLAGTEDQDTVSATISVAVKSRMPWLMASWFGGTCGAMLLGSFSSAFEKIIALAFFMPVVFGMGGNIGSQSSTITVRGLATGELSHHKIFRRLRKEALVGMILGLSFAILLGSAAFLLYHDFRLSFIVGVSILVTMVCASSIGSMLPVLFDRFNVDPAVASGPFVTTTTDFLSIIIYFSIASFFI